MIKRDPLAILEIVKFPDPGLKRRAEDVSSLNEQIRTLVRDMFETMYAAPGVGLAAPQVGVPIRLFIIDPGNNTEGRGKCPQAIINPVVVKAEGEMEWEEGCLSIPEFKEKIPRKSRVWIKGLNEKGEEVKLEGEGLLSAILQHEMDHLNGVLILDRVSRLKRNLYLKDLRKKAQGDG